MPRHFVLAAYAFVSLAFGTPSTAGARQCPGDCNGDGVVTIDELISAVNIALDNSTVAGCPNADSDADGSVTIDEIIAAVDNALNRCPAAETPTPTPQRSADIRRGPTTARRG